MVCNTFETDRAGMDKNAVFPGFFAHYAGIFQTSQKFYKIKSDKLCPKSVYICEEGNRGEDYQMNEREYQALINEYVPVLYRVARSVLRNDQDCADAVQEAVFQGWIKRAQLRDAERFKPWITRITINECRNLQRRSAREMNALSVSAQEMRTQGDERHLQRQKVDLEAALSEMPDKYSLPLVLHYVEDYPTRDIAGMLEIPEGRLRERMRTARKMLGRLLGHE